MRFILLIITFSVFFACKQPEKKASKQEEKINLDIPSLSLESANRLSALPSACINKEYPNKLGQVLGDEEDLKSPKELHPAFYGCFDWHSSVHGHWSLVSLLKQFPTLDNAEGLKMKLLINISAENIKKEVEYFKGKHNKSYERTYGWAWLLKLAEELHTWNDPVAKKLEENLQPLTDLIVQKYLDFLPKLIYPIRVGEHTNTAFGLTFAWDYAIATGNKELEDLIKKRAKDFYLKDADCPLNWEPSGYDFLSPCLQEAAIMKRVLLPAQFRLWFADFLPQLKEENFDLKIGKVSDRKDGKLVHLDGVNFSRAWALLKIIEDMPEYKHLKVVAYKHINHSLPNVVGDSYEGGHWLGSFAIYSLNSI